MCFFCLQEGTLITLQNKATRVLVLWLAYILRQEEEDQKQAVLGVEGEDATFVHQRFVKKKCLFFVLVQF